MFKVYYTNPKEPQTALAQNVSELTNALQCCEYLRGAGMVYVTMVSDYEQMTGKPGAKMSGTEYVPQMLNP
jgi:hypothetical protein